MVVLICLLKCIIEGVDRASNLLTHAVDAVGSQQVDSLLHQICASAAEHTEAQVLQELCFSGGSIQSPRGTDAVIRSEGQSTGFTGQARVLCYPSTPQRRKVGREEKKSSLTASLGLLISHVFFCVYI